MSRFLKLVPVCILVVNASLVSAQSLIEKPANLQSLSEAWQWAQADTLAADAAWIAYGFSTRIDERLGINFSTDNDNYIQWNRAGYSGWGNHWHFSSGGSWQNRQSLEALLVGVETLQQSHEVQKELLFLLRVEAGEAKEIHLASYDALVQWRNVAVYWLGRFAEEESFRHVIDLLPQYQDQAIRRTLLRTLGVHQSADRNAALIALLSDDNYSEFTPVILESLAMRKSPQVQDRLSIVAEDDNADAITRRVAISALSRYDDAANVQLLADLSEQGNPQAIRREAIESLSLIPGRTSLRVLQEVVAADDNRAVVLEALRGLSRDLQQYEAIAEAARSHGDADIRETALRLAAGMDGRRAFTLLERAFNEDPDRDVREEVLQTMESVPAELAVPFLLAVANNRNAYDEDLRSEAVDTLAEFDANLVLTDLNRLAWSDDSDEVRENAVKALADLSDGTVNGLLMEIARNHPSNHTRREAMDELQDRVL